MTDQPAGEGDNMSDLLKVGPTNDFIEFRQEDVEQSIPDRFQQQVDKYPQRLAVKTRTHELTYDALNKAANRVSQAILNLRGEGEEPVALLLEHGTPVLIGIFGVLKTGKIYMPLDSTFPRARIDYILENSQAGLIITNNKNLSLARELSQNKLQLINIDELDAGLSTENPELSISPDASVWILFTSGSTGRPKGTVQNHRNVLHFTMNYTNNYHICADDRHILVYPCSFSGSATDIFAALLNGSSLFPFDLRTEVLSDLVNWLIQERVTIYHSPPTIFRHLLNSFTGDERFPNLRLIDMASEPVHKRDVELYKKHFSPDCIFVNRLGSSELNVIRRYFIDKNTEITGSIVPIGYAVEDTEILLLDDDGKDVGFNKEGEIVIKSRYLSPGYWRQPDITQAKFQPDPEGGDARLYYTGDLGLMLPDGCLLHMGRKDFQVKVRGFRIEVGEIEMALLGHDAIKETAVWVHEEQSGDKRLVGYLVPSGKQMPNVTELRQFLARTLPEYMIPSTFITLDALPLTPNGKLDRLALPSPDTTRPELAGVFVAPRDELEHKLIRIWEEILGVHPIGVKDGFFELGGDSLLAMQMFNQIQNTFGKNLPLAILFQASNVEELASILRQEGWSQPSSLLVTIQSGDSRRPLFCPHGCGCEVLIYKDLARNLGTEQPFYALRAQGVYGEKPPRSRIEDMAAHYIREIRTIQPEGPYFIGGGGDGGWVAFEMAQQLLAQGQEVPLLIIMDAFYRKQYAQRAQTNSSSSKPSPPKATVSRKSPIHYVRRSFHHLLRGQFVRIFRDNFRVIYEKYCWRFAYSSIPRRIKYIQRHIDYMEYTKRLMARASFSYSPRVYPGRIVYFLSEKRKEYFNEYWYELADGGLDVTVVPGDHSAIWKEPNVQVMAEKLRACLDKVQADGSTVKR